MKKFPFSVSRMFALPAIAALLALGGCASPVTHEGMQPVDLKVRQHHPETVSVTTDGGSGTSALGKSQIDNAELERAVTDAIKQSKTFSRVLPAKGGDYLLTVNIFTVNQPTMGFSFTVNLEMGWTLTRASTGAKVWQESITSEYTAGATDAFAGVTRLRMATEGAARNNISKALKKIAALKLD